LERDMAALADTQLRYEADAKLLQAAYARLRTAMRERG
jgi:flagellar basal body rod protein FlgB